MTSISQGGSSMLPSTRHFGIVTRLIVVAAIAITLTAANPSDHKLRVIIETDAGGDPDDEQSLVRFLLYTTTKPAQAKVENPPSQQPLTPAPQIAKAEKPVRTDRYGDPLPEGALMRLGTVRFRIPD